jgi:hypothetical protein
MLIASAVLVAALGYYAVLCAVKPFARKLRLRAGRRAHNAWRRTHEAGAR